MEKDQIKQIGGKIWTKIAWFYNWFVARPVFRRKEFLSNIVCQEIIPYKKELKSRISLSNVLSGKKWVFVALAAPILLTVILSLVIDSLINLSPSTEKVNDLISTNHTVGGVLAAFTAVLVALMLKYIITSFVPH